MRAVAIIPARGGSKGISRKNLRYCGGKPLVDWTLEAAEQSKYLTAALLSSDDAEILERGCNYSKITPVRRSLGISGAEAQIEPAMREALHEWGSGFDAVVMLQPTSPLRTAIDIDTALGLLYTGVDSIVGVVRSHALLWARKQPLYNLKQRPRRQDRHTYEENGAIYVTRRSAWERSGLRISGRIDYYIMDEEHRLQVDSELDLKLIDFLLSERQELAAQQSGG